MSLNSTHWTVNIYWRCHNLQGPNLLFFSDTGTMFTMITIYQANDYICFPENHCALCVQYLLLVVYTGLTGLKRQNHITPILASLHWLPVRFRIDFKILLITFKAHQGLAPSYITESMTPYVPSRSLRSSGGTLLAVPNKRWPCFCHQGPSALERPEEIRLAESGTSFKSLLKTHFYWLAFMWYCNFIVFFSPFILLIHLF